MIYIYIYIYIMSSDVVKLCVIKRGLQYCIFNNFERDYLMSLMIFFPVYL